MEKLTKNQARDILNSIDLPESSNRVTVLAIGTKSARQNILLNPYHEDRETAAAIEIQRFWRGYLLRCRLYHALQPRVSLDTQADSGHDRLIEVSANQSASGSSSSHSAEVAILVTKASSTLLCNDQDFDKSSSRSKLEEAYVKYSDENEPISFEDYCALIIQSWWHQVSEEQRYFRVPPVRPPTMEENYSSGRTTQLMMASSQRSGASSLRSGGVLSRLAAAKIIQRAWRSHIDMQVYRYYRDLISFKFHGDPVFLLRCINPREAGLLDSASGTHVKFRLAGAKFPPNIYYKIFTHRPVIDMCASSPKDYTKASVKQLVARQCHNKEQFVSNEGEKEGWYQRHENNGWRLVSDRIIGKIGQDVVAYDSAQTKMEFKHSRILRKQDMEKKRKNKKIQWMKKMYRDGMLWTKRGTESPIERDLENTVKGIADMTDKLGHGGVEEWEVDELLEWTNGLNFDHYVTDWKEFGTSARSDHIVREKLRLFPEDKLPMTLSR